MQSLTVTGPGALEWTDVPTPQLDAPEAALVRPVVVATCDFDHLIVAGRAPVPYPVQIGHEMVAEVLEVGAHVRGVTPGDRVIVPFQISCGSCSNCARARTSCCDAVPWLSCYGLGDGSGGWGGAVSDVVRVPYADGMLIPVPDGLAPEIAAAAGCNLTDAYRCVVPQLRAAPDGPVLIVAHGFRNIGLACVAFARAVSDAPVHVVGLDGALAERARKAGAEVLESMQEVERQAYAVVVDASMDADHLATALGATAPGGTCTVSAMYPQPLTPVPLLDLFSACATVHTGQPHVRGLLPEVLELLAGSAFPAELIIDESHPWEDAITAFGSPGKHVIVR